MNGTPMSQNDALRMAAALVLHHKRGDVQLVRILRGEVNSLADSEQLTGALLVLIDHVLVHTSVSHIERLMNSWIDKINLDDAGAP